MADNLLLKKQKHSEGINFFRGIMDENQLKSLRVPLDKKLNKIFKKPFGKIGETKRDSIELKEASIFFDRLRAIAIGQSVNLVLFDSFFCGHTGEDKTKCEMCALRLSLVSMHTLSARFVEGRKKTSRVVIEALTLAGVNSTSPAIQKWMMDWSTSFQDVECDYEILWNLEAFDSLGKMEPDQGRSCFAPQSEWQDAPIALAAGFFKKVPTFIVKIKKNGGIAARCWGFAIPNKKTFYLTNGYYITGFRSSMAHFARALEAACDIPLVYKAQNDLASLPVFVNRDAVIVYPMSMLNVDENIKTLKKSRRILTCRLCKKKKNKRNNGYTHAICEMCVGLADVISCSHCKDFEYVYDMRNCNECNNHYCSRKNSCFNDTHFYCSNYGHWTCKGVKDYYIYNNKEKALICLGCINKSDMNTDILYCGVHDCYYRKTFLRKECFLCKKEKETDIDDSFSIEYCEKFVFAAVLPETVISY